MDSGVKGLEINLSRLWIRQVREGLAQLGEDSFPEDIVMLHL